MKKSCKILNQHEGNRRQFALPSKLGWDLKNNKNLRLASIPLPESAYLMDEWKND